MVLRRFFAANRYAEPPGPAPQPQRGFKKHNRRRYSKDSPAQRFGHNGVAGDMNPDTQETLQAVRVRQRERQRRYMMNMMRAEKERDVAHDAGDERRAAAAEAQRRQMSDAADVFAQQIDIIERIMQDFGLIADLDDDGVMEQRLLHDGYAAYEYHTVQVAEAAGRMHQHNEDMRNHLAQYTMSNEVYDEDEVMRELDEIARRTGRV